MSAETMSQEDRARNRVLNILLLMGITGLIGMAIFTFHMRGERNAWNTAPAHAVIKPLVKASEISFLLSVETTRDGKESQLISLMDERAIPLVGQALDDVQKKYGR